MIRTAGFRFLIAVLFSVGGVAVCRSSLAAGSQPGANILLILADDMGYGDLGITGATDIPTPHLDALARNGVFCTAAYVTAPYCSPSRAGLVTGRYQNRFGYEFNPTHRMPGAGLPPAQDTLAERLRPAGYTTGLVGKWHLGTSEGQHPLEQGFDEFFGFLDGGHTYFPKGKGSIVRGRDRIQEHEYLTDAFGREASDFVARHRDRPWFLFLSFNAVHDPMQPKPEDLARVPDAIGKLRHPYAGMMVAMDDAIGRVMERVRSTGQAGKTLVIFINDNGGPTAPINTNVNGSLNSPFRGGKRQLSEGGIRVPLILSWPGRLPAGRQYREPVMAFDLVPTALAAAHAPVPPEAPVDGVDLIPFLRGERNGPPHRALFWRFGWQFAVREGDWKLVRWKHDDGQGFTSGLFNVRNDPTESVNLSSAHPEQVARLRDAWRQWNLRNPPPAFGAPAELTEAQELAQEFAKE